MKTTSYAAKIVTVTIFFAKTIMPILHHKFTRKNVTVPNSFFTSSEAKLLD